MSLLFRYKYIFKDTSHQLNKLHFSTAASSINATDKKKKKSSGFDERKAETEALNKFLTTAEEARRYYLMDAINDQFYSLNT